jgi:tetratricopeptide (TPR) repeat protein
LGGLLLTVAACGARFYAEWHWIAAQTLEEQGQLDNARAELDRAVDLYSEFELLERTWLLAGKIDYRRGKSTPQAMYYRVAQLALHDDRGEAVGLLHDLLNSPVGRATAVRDLAGLIHADLARKSTSKGQLIAAFDDYRLAAKFAPLRVDAPAGMGLSLSESDRSRPELAEAYINPLVERLGDRVLIADLLERLGHANFEAGRVVRAREYYERSMAIFSQPKYVNAPAQEGLLGM